MVPRARGVWGTCQQEALESEEKVHLELQAYQLQPKLWVIKYYFPLKSYCSVHFGFYHLQSTISFSNTTNSEV